MDTRKCVVTDCTFNKSRKFHFPSVTREKERALKWISACGRGALKKNENYVCEAHFEKRYMLGTKLTTSAFPTLNLPEPLDNSLCLERLKELRKTQSPARVRKPHVVPPQHLSIAEQVQDADDGAQSSAPPATAEDGAQSSAPPATAEDGAQSSAPSATAEENLPGSSGVLKEMQRPHEHAKRTGSLLELCSITNKGNLTQREKIMYGKICNLKHMVRGLKARNMSLQAALKHATNFAQSPQFQFFSELPEAARNFFMNNIQNQNRNKHARKFTAKDKDKIVFKPSRSSVRLGVRRVLVSVDDLRNIRKLKRI